MSSSSRKDKAAKMRSPGHNTIDVSTDEGLEKLVHQALRQVETTRNEGKANLLKESLRLSRDEVLKRRMIREPKCYPRLPTNGDPPLPLLSQLYCQPCSDRTSADESDGNSDMSDLSVASASNPIVLPSVQRKPVIVRLRSNKGKLWTESLPYPILLEGAPDPLPRSSTTVFLKSHFFADDEQHLTYVPYFGEDDHDVGVLELFDTKQREKRMVFGAECIERDFNDTIDEILSFIQNQLQKNHLVKDWPEPIKKTASPVTLRSRRQHRIHAVLAEILDEDIDRIHDRYRLLVEKADNQGGSSVSDEGEAKIDPSYLDVVDSYRRLFCRRCFSYDCHIHGNLDKPDLELQTELAFRKEIDGFWGVESIETVASSSSDNDHKPAAMSETQLRQKRRLTHALDRIDKNLADLTELSESQKILCERMFTVFHGDEDKVAFTLGVPRKLVADYAALKGLDSGDFEELPVNAEWDSRKGKKKRKTDDKSMKLYNPVWLRNVEGAEIHPFFNPCDHTGPCSEENCTCVKLSQFCTKHCVWGHKSRNFFRGCNCKSKCTNKTCSCFAAKRECDPDLCRSCGACSDPPNKPATTQRCCNDNISMRRHCHLLLARSSVPDAGWGLYTKHALKRGDFIIEYVGELITQEEAERRGKIYDKVNRSYLFNLCSDTVVDASRKGNKARFANHSSKPNCETRIISVNGDNRIGVFATQDIEPQSELFFDYRYDSTMDNELIIKAAMTVDWQKNPKMANKVKKMRA